MPLQNIDLFSPSISLAMEMPGILPRIFFLYKLLNSFFVSLVPTELRSLFPSSWYDHSHDCDEETENPPPSVRGHSSSSSSPALVLHRDSLELRRVFEMFDENGDGKITKRELKHSLDNMGICMPESELAQVINKVDVNGDGCVDMGEFQVLCQTIMQQGGCGGDEKSDDKGGEEEDLLNAFEVFDKNGDGFITGDELGSVLSSLGLGQGRNVEDCRKMILKVDVDGDGMVSFEEFKGMMKDCGFAANWI